jgi:VWFA-related protein
MGALSPMVFALLLLVSLPLTAQEPPSFRAETSLALVRFHVVHDNTYVLNLKPEDIQLLEDGKPRKFSVFEGGRAGSKKMPVNLVLLFDISGSVVNAGLLNPLVFKTSILDGLGNARIAVYAFSDDLRRYCRPTRHLAVLEAAFHALDKRETGELIALKLPPKRTVRRPGTWIYAAVMATAQEFAPKPDVHSTVSYDPATASSDSAAAPDLATTMVLTFSDGLDTTSAIPEDASGLCQELGIPVYPAVLGYRNLLDQIKLAKEAGGDRPGNTDPRPGMRLMNLEAQKADVQRFTRLGPLTGGRAFDLPQIGLGVMQQILDFIAGQIRHQYLVGFVPEVSASAPRSHKLEVQLVDKTIGKISDGTRTLVH